MDSYYIKDDIKEYNRKEYIKEYNRKFRIEIAKHSANMDLLYNLSTCIMLLSLLILAIKSYILNI